MTTAPGEAIFNLVPSGTAESTCGYAHQITTGSGSSRMPKRS